MVRKLIEWAVNSPLIVILMALSLAVFGFYSFLHVNVEAYPDPAPAIIEVVAQYPGASAEEVERQVSIPLEVTLAGMPGLKFLRSKSLFGLSHLRTQFEYGHDYDKARQEVINRLQFTQPLPQGVTPQLSPESPTGEIYRYTLRSPKDDFGNEIFTLNDLKANQDWVLEREFRRVPRIVDVTSYGGTIKRYEVHPDPLALKRYNITLPQLQNAITVANGNAGGDYLVQGRTALNVRGVGLVGEGLDPVTKVLGFEKQGQDAYLARLPQLSAKQKERIRDGLARRATDPPLTRDEQRHVRNIEQRAGLRAAEVIRAEEERRIREIRRTVITSNNNVPIRVEHVVEGGPLEPGEPVGRRGVVVSHQTRLGRVGHWRVGQSYDEDDKVECIVLLRKNEESLPALKDVEAKVAQLNDPQSGKLLPGVKIEPYYDRTDLIGITTETVRENLLLGMALVTIILFMFLTNVRTALIVAINIPLALLFAFSVLFLRGKSANLLSIGAVDFGIIVDSSVIMVENVYRYLAAGEHAALPIKERILQAVRQIDKALLFSTAIMVCAFIPLFTMTGPEGQLFGPMAQTYAFALAGALLLALTLTPVLCLLFLKNLRPRPDNFLVRFMKSRYLWQLKVCLKYRWLTIGVMGGLMVLTVVFGLPHLGREFMPELEEGNLWVRGTFPVNSSLEETTEKVRIARGIVRQYGEVETIVTQLGRPDDGTDSTGFYNAELFVTLKPEKDWPTPKGRDRPRTKPELVKDMNAELTGTLIGVDWNFSQNIRDNVMESLSGVKGDNSVKIFGPDLDDLERVAERVKNELEKVRGIDNVGIFRIKGQSNLEFRADRAKCDLWGVSVADVNNVIRTAVGGQPFTQMVEGEKTFDITLRWPQRLRGDLSVILDMPVDIINNTVSQGSTPSKAQTPVTGPSTGVTVTGTSVAFPSLVGSQFNAPIMDMATAPRLLLRDLVSPVGEDVPGDSQAHYIRSGASTIYREQGERLIAVKFSVLPERDLAGAVAEAQQRTAGLFKAPYRAVWSGEFEQMEDAEGRLLLIIPLSLGLIFILLYLAFRSLLDAVVVLSNVLAIGVGGVWALLLTGTNFSISAAVGFVSLFGVAIMDGLLMVSYFNDLRAKGLPLAEAIIQGAAQRVRPVMMTALTAILGLLPAALSTRIGSQTQRPLAIVVVGGMLMALFLTRYLMPILYSFYGHREPPADASRLAH
jgi:cobalt-zinc-cadmium resistance protein CzcA